MNNVSRGHASTAPSLSSLPSLPSPSHGSTLSVTDGGPPGLHKRKSLFRRKSSKYQLFVAISSQKQ
jgi:hypothetical protein